MATIDPVDIGAVADDGTGDPLRTAFQKLNAAAQALNAELAEKALAVHAHDTSGLANGAVTYVKMQPMSAGSRLLGCGTDGSGVVREITLGTNLSMSGNTLNASGSGAGSADWGTIGGDIADQTDLQAALADGTTHTHTTAAITSGTFANARIAQSNVTQHQAALSIALSQITGDGALAALNTVGTPQIDNDAVNEDKLADGAVTGTKIANDAIDSQHIAAGALDAEHYAADSVGPDALAHTAVTPGSYTLGSFTVDQQGRLTAASSGSGTDAAGSRVPTVSGVLAVTADDHEVTKGITLVTDQANAVFTIEDDTPAGAIFKFGPGHDGATVVIEGDAGSIDGVSAGTAILINGGVAFLEVVSNAGTAPTCVTYGDVIHAPTEVSSTKAYDNNDSNQVFVLTSGAGTQTFSTAVASMPAGFEVTIINESGGNITIDGLDADHTLADNGFVTVIKPHTSLLAVGSAGTTVLDAA